MSDVIKTMEELGRALDQGKQIELLFGCKWIDDDVTCCAMADVCKYVREGRYRIKAGPRVIEREYSIEDYHFRSMKPPELWTAEEIEELNNDKATFSRVRVRIEEIDK